jgi:hypothetical protein
VQVQGIGLNTIQFAVCSAYLRLSLIEIRLCAGLAIQLFYFIALHIKQVAVISLLVTRGKTTEDEDVLVRYLEEAATLETDPVCVLFDFQVQGLPLLSPLKIEFLYQVCSLSTIETSYHIE